MSWSPEGKLAADYLDEAYKILKAEGYEEWSVGDAIRLAHVIALETQNAELCARWREIRQAIDDK